MTNLSYLPEDEPYIKMVYDIAHQFGENTRCGFEDYVNVGLMALHKARETFDDTRDIQFQTHAYTLIKRAILKEWQNNNNLLSCSPYHIKNTDGAKEEVSRQNATAISVYTETGNGEGRGSMLQNVISVSGINRDARNMASGDLSPVENAERDEIISKVDHILGDLDKDDRNIIIRRVFQGETFQYIADSMNMSWRKVNTRFHKLTAKLQDKFIEAGLDIYA